MENEAPGGENSQTFAAEISCTGGGSARAGAGSPILVAFPITKATPIRSSNGRVLLMDILRARRIFQLRLYFVGLLELRTRLCLLSLLVKGQSQIEVRVRVARFQAHGFQEFPLCCAEIASLEEHQT